LFLHLCQELHYTPITFFAHDQYKKEIYHTNVMMCIADTFAVICLESITSEEERTNVLRALDSSGHQVIAISFEQMNQFAGNMLALKTTTGKAILVLSQSAFTALNHDQKQAIATHCQPLPLNITTIETIGGGSARCMIAEIFTPIR
jgi:hypothetical protein